MFRPRAQPAASDVMTDIGGGFVDYRALDQKIETVEQRVEAKLDRFENKFNESFQNLQTNLTAQIRTSSAKNGGSSQVIPLLSLGLGIVLLFGSVLTFIYSDLSASIKRTDDSLKDSVEKVTNAHDKEQALRADSERRIYDSITRVNDQTWHKDAQVEFERREDEIRDLQFTVAKDAITTLTGGLERLAVNIVPRAEHEQQWNNEKELIARVESGLNNSMNRLAEHVNKGDDRAATKFDELERETHPYGTADVFRELQTRVQDVQDKLFRLLVPSPPPTSGPGPNKD
jgi:Na+-transporting methylmalonyl-CoA/oxaloacetate decarboxylase gamma subunit